MSDRIGNDNKVFVKGGAVAKAKEERLKREALAKAEKEAKKKAEEEAKAKEKAEKKAEKEAEEAEKAREKAEKKAEKEAEEAEKAKEKAEKEAEKEAEEARKAKEEIEKEAEEAERAKEKAEKEAEEAEKAKEKAKKEAEEAEKAKEKAEKEAEEKAKEKADNEAEKDEEVAEESGEKPENRRKYEYFFKRFAFFNNKDRTEEIAEGYKTSYDVIDGVLKAKKKMKNSEKFFTKLAEYKSARLEYEISIGKYQFGYDDVEVRQIELDKRIRRYVRNIKWRALKARIFEFFDNRRYLKALNLTAEARSLRTIARPAIIDRSKVTLLALLERRNEINDELLDLYKKRNQDYLDAEKKNSELNIRLRARKHAFDKLYDIERKVEQYAFTADEREDVYRRMNALVNMDVDVKVLKYEEKQAPKGERELYKETIKAKKDIMAKMEDALVALVEKAHRRTYIDDKRHVWIWILGVAAVAGLLIVLFGIFSEQITEFIMNWALESR